MTPLPKRPGLTYSKKRVECEDRARAKRARQATCESRGYVLDGLLLRKAIDPEDNAFSHRVVIPAGGNRRLH